MTSEVAAAAEVDTGDEEPTGMDRTDAEMAEVKQPLPSRRTPRRVAVTRLFAFLFVVAISAVLVLYGNRLAGLGAYGYPGLFLLNLLSSATLILPAPGLALALAAGATMNPYLVGLAVGSGSTLGELTGYIAGASGRGMVEDDPNYPRVREWMSKYGLWVIFVLSVVPNPIFDVAGIVAGAMHIPVWKFLAATWCGKLIKSTLVALAGAGAMQALGPIIERWLTR